ncbi:MAG TPA: hypothetical protein PK762_09900, partial [Candidatus Kapabacteria bacterium]|nr:hypothetical protein [Candidatus Kapabacteria bacterium]
MQKNDITMEKLMITLIIILLMSCGNNSPKTNIELKQKQENEIEKNSKEKLENITSKFISEFDISTMLLNKYFGAFG